MMYRQGDVLLMPVAALPAEPRGAAARLCWDGAESLYLLVGPMGTLAMTPAWLARYVDGTPGGRLMPTAMQLGTRLGWEQRALPLRARCVRRYRYERHGDLYYFEAWA